MTVTVGRVGAPIVDPSRGWKPWSISDIYTGPDGTGQYVPNPDDIIFDFHKNVMRKVVEVDYTNFTYRDIIWQPTSVLNGDGVGGNGEAHITNSYRIYVDTSKHPATLRCDPRILLPGSDLDRIRIFKGMDTSDEGEVISAYFQNGMLVGDTIPMVTASITGNKTLKHPVPGHLKGEIDNNELVTIVAYSDTNEVAYIVYCYVVITNMVMAAENPSRQVMDVRLKSIFLSPSDTRLLELPTNIPIEDIPLQYEVIYNDGRSEGTIDGTRCSLNGLKNSGAHDPFFISTSLGQKLPLTLVYRLGKNETYAGDNLVDGNILKDYNAITKPVDGAYSVKLFVIPVWMGVGQGWRLQYFLYNLERGSFYDATSAVRTANNTPSFDPKLYGVKQHLGVNVDLAAVSPVYNTHPHTETFAVTLLAQGGEARDNFLIEYNQGHDDFGQGIQALFHYDNVKHWLLDVSCGAKDQGEWLTRLYRNVYPIFDVTTEDVAPEPTHYEVVVGGQSYVRPVSDWMSAFNINAQPRHGETAQIRWIRRTATEDLQLAMTPLVVKQKP